MFTYNLVSFWSGGSNATLPAGLEDISVTDYHGITVTAIAGSDVLTHTLLRFKKDAEVENDGYLNTETNAYLGNRNACASRIRLDYIRYAILLCVIWQ